MRAGLLRLAHLSREMSSCETCMESARYAASMQTISCFPLVLYRMRRVSLALVFLSLASAAGLDAGAQGPLPASPAATTPAASMPAASAKNFDEVANAALLAMRQRAGEIGISGVAVVAYFEGESVQSWSSKMVVVGRMKDVPTATNKGSNLLAIAYSKAAEMADTLKDSGSQVRPPMTGEFGWNGGVILRGKAGYLIAAFSGGKSEDDVKVSRAGVEVLKSRL